MKGTKLDPNQETLLIKRLRAVNDRLNPGSEGDLEKVATIEAMVAHYKALRPFSLDPEPTERYLFAVREFPAWAVIDACAMAMANKVEFLSSDTCPMPHDLEKVCHLVVRKLTRERTGLYKALEHVS